MADMAQPKTQTNDQSHDEVLKLITEKVESLLVELDSHGKKSVELSRQIGAQLAIAKKILPHGKYTSWHEVTLKLGASQASVYRRLFEAGDDLNRAREWAKSTGHAHRDSDSPERLLVIIKEWKKATRQVSNGDESAKPKANFYVEKLKALLETDETATSLRDTRTRGVAVTLEKAAAAILAHRSSSGVDVLGRSHEYLAYLVNLLADQTPGVPQVSTGPGEGLPVDHDSDDVESRHERPEPAPEIVGSSRAGDPKDSVHGKNVLMNARASSLMRATDRR
jgi:hypothetical protein